MLVEQRQDVVDDCVLGLRQQVRLRKSGLRNTSAGIIAFYNCKRPMKCGAISQKGGRGFQALPRTVDGVAILRHLSRMKSCVWRLHSDG
jgi:hypothetical protein